MSSSSTRSSPRTTPTTSISSRSIDSGKNINRTDSISYASWVEYLKTSSWDQRGDDLVRLFGIENPRPNLILPDGTMAKRCHVELNQVQFPSQEKNKQFKVRIVSNEAMEVTIIIENNQSNERQFCTFQTMKDIRAENCTDIEDQAIMEALIRSLIGVSSLKIEKKAKATIATNANEKKKSEPNQMAGLVDLITSPSLPSSSSSSSSSAVTASRLLHYNGGASQKKKHNKQSSSSCIMTTSSSYLELTFPCFDFYSKKHKFLLQKQEDFLLQKIDFFKKENEKLYGFLFEADQKNEKVGKKNQNLHKKIQNLQKKNENLQKNHENLQKENRFLKKQVQELLVTDTKKNNNIVTTSCSSSSSSSSSTAAVAVIAATATAPAPALALSNTTTTTTTTATAATITYTAATTVLLPEAIVLEAERSKIPSEDGGRIEWSKVLSKDSDFFVLAANASMISIKKTGMYQINIVIDHLADSRVLFFHGCSVETEKSFLFQKTRPVAGTNRYVSRLDLSFLLSENENIYLLIDSKQSATFDHAKTEALIARPSESRMSLLYLGEQEWEDVDV
jgi:hypothetical protein